MIGVMCFELLNNLPFTKLTVHACNMFTHQHSKWLVEMTIVFFTVIYIYMDQGQGLVNLDMKHPQNYISGQAHHST